MPKQPAEGVPSRGGPGTAPTIHDVARHAGVSTRTVTNVLNDFQFVAPTTRDRVRASITSLNYRPSAVAKNLRLGRSGIIAVAVPELGVPYFSELCEAIVDQAARRSYKVIIEKTSGDPAVERQLLEDPSRARLFDGLIFSPLGLGGDELRRASGKAPIVLLGERVRDGEFDHVTIDNVKAAHDVVTHLVAIGRRRIAAIGHQPKRRYGAGECRTRGYRIALEEAGLPYDESLVMPSDDFHRSSGASGMSALLDLPIPPDAVFCYNDLIAIGAIRTILNSGRKVPAQIAVVGFDDIEESRYSTPSVTTISPNKEEIAAAAVDQLLRRLDGDSSPPVVVNGSYELKVRESSVGVRSQGSTGYSSVV